MLKKALTIIFFLLIILDSFSQGIQDSIFKIQDVQVTAKRIFDKEEAGMKQTDVDSMVLATKIDASLSELLSENTSVFIKSNGRGALSTASFRGTAASHTNVNWNGMNINSPMTGMVDFSLIPVYIIDDMNLKHGSASVADQSGGLGGSININNRVSWDKGFNLKYLQGVGSYSTWDEFLQVGGGNKKFQSKTRLYHNYSKNDYTFTNYAVGDIDPVTGQVSGTLDTNHNADYTRYGLLQEFYFKPGAKSVFSAKYWGQLAERTIPTATSSEGPDNSNMNRQYDTDHKVVADWKYYSGNYKFSLRTGYTQKDLDYLSYHQVSGQDRIPSVYSTSTSESFLNNAYFSHNVNESLSYETSIDANFVSVNSNDSVTDLGYDKSREEFSLFLAVRKSFSEAINVNLMFRQGYVDGEFLPFVPFCGVDAKPFAQTDFVLKGSYAINYHQPTLNDLYWQPSGNPDLLPELGNTIEIGAEYQKQIQSHVLYGEMAMYRSDIENWIIWIPTFKDYSEPVNIEHVIAKGIEVDISLKGLFGKLAYKIGGTYSYTNSKNLGNKSTWGDAYGKQLVYIPLHSGNVLFNLTYKGFSFTYQHNSYSERFTTSTNDPTSRRRLYPYFMNDVTFAKEWTLKKSALSAEFKIHNLLNETYHSVLYRPMPKRNYMLLLMYRI